MLPEATRNASPKSATLWGKSKGGEGGFVRRDEGAQATGAVRVSWAFRLQAGRLRWAKPGISRGTHISQGQACPALNESGAPAATCTDRHGCNFGGLCGAGPQAPKPRAEEGAAPSRRRSVGAAVPLLMGRGRGLPLMEWDAPAGAERQLFCRCRHRRAATCTAITGAPPPLQARFSSHLDARILVLRHVEQILRLDVPMDDAARSQVLERERHLPDYQGSRGLR